MSAARGQSRPRSRLRPAALTARFIGGQMRTDRWALVVALLIVALATFLTAAIPPAVNGVVTEQVRGTMAQAGADAQVELDVRLDPTGDVPYDLQPGTADLSADVSRILDQGMPPTLASVLGPPVTTIVSGQLKGGLVDGQPSQMQFAYVANESGPGMEWIAGAAPGNASDPAAVQYQDDPLPIEVGLSEAVATLMGVEVGDKIPVQNRNEADLDVTVTGIFRATDPADTAWSTVPTLLNPQLGVGDASITNYAAYVSAESLPYARFAVRPDGLTRFYTYPINASAFTADNVRQVQEEARGLASGKQVFDVPDSNPKVNTRLDAEIALALDATTAATAQASVLLVAMVSLALAVELVAAGMLVGRRRTVLAQARSRGATAGAIARALGVESAVVVVFGGAAGLALAHYAVEGAIAWQWVVPPLLVAFVAAPFLAARGAARRPGANPAQGIRRIAGEVALVLLAAASTASLVTRGVSASEGSLWADLLVLAAPVLCSLAVAVLLLRVLPPLTRWARALAARRTSVAPLLATARTRITASAVCALLLVASVMSMAATTGATVTRGLAAAADDQLGADVVARGAFNDPLPAAVEDINGSGGVNAALAYVARGANLVGLRVGKPVTVVAVDTDDFDAMASADGVLPSLDALTHNGTDTGDKLPMLISAGSADLRDVSLRWQDLSVHAQRVGPGVAVPGIPADEIVVVVDRAALAKALGAPVPATFVWANGTGAEDAVRKAVGDVPATVTTRAEWLHAQESSPVASGLRTLFLVTIGMGLALGLLAAALIAASGSGARRRATGRLRVLGLPRAQAWRIAQLELALPVVIVTAVGVVTGAVLAGVVRVPLHLASITGQSASPTTVVPWWIVAIPLVVGGTAWVAVGFAARADRSANLGQVLRTE